MKSIKELLIGLSVGLFFSIESFFFLGNNKTRSILVLLFILTGLLTGYLIGVKRKESVSNKVVLIWIIALIILLVLSMAIMLLNWP